MEPTIAERLRMDTFSAKECRAAIRGENLPLAFGLPLTQLCIIRGIRYQKDAIPDEFAKELYGAHPLFSRALNARRIMSDSLHLLPDILTPEETPYCIWHPRTASESTYRELVAKYPQLKYQVGRACAVASYTNLYKELDILPDVHIAEEARECGSTEIYESITAAPIRYDVMNDYTRTINTTNPQPGDLNGNTAVLWSLDYKQTFTFVRPDQGYDGYTDNTFNITEDMNIDEYDTWPTSTDPVPRYDVASLLSAPLPRDLPTTEKDMLILMAAYHGNIDRYVRLRRPEMTLKEQHCCVRGIYNNTQFALWWSRQPDPPRDIRRAIHARFIMNNVLSTLDESTDIEDLPYLIWYPTIAVQSTYQELYRRQPSMAPQILRACIAGRYRKLFDAILADIVPDAALLGIAELHTTQAPEHKEQRFMEKILARATQLGIQPPNGNEQDWKWARTEELEPSYNGFQERFDTTLVGIGWDSLYNGLSCDVSPVDFLTSLSKEMKEMLRRERDESGEHVELDYGFSRTIDDY